MMWQKGKCQALQEDMFSKCWLASVLVCRHCPARRGRLGDNMAPLLLLLSYCPAHWWRADSLFLLLLLFCLCVSLSALSPFCHVYVRVIHVIDPVVALCASCVREADPGSGLIMNESKRRITSRRWSTLLQLLLFDMSLMSSIICN